MTADSSGFTPDELRTLARALLEGSTLACPSCDVPMDRRPVPPRRDVSYVRRRLWLVCPRCRESAVIDVPPPR